MPVVAALGGKEDQVYKQPILVNFIDCPLSGASGVLGGSSYGDPTAPYSFGSGGGSNVGGSGGGYISVNADYIELEGLASVISSTTLT